MMAQTKQGYRANLSDILPFIIPILVGFLLWQMPVPEGLNPKAWSLFSIFVATIMGIVFKPFPMGAVALMGLLALVLTKTITLDKQGLSGYESPVVWLVVYVFFIARGFIKTQLGTRVAYFFISLIGRSTLGLGYGIILTELLVAPVIPSNTARAGGIIYPIVRSICDSLGSRPNDGTERKLGAFLTQVCIHGNLITSAMFLTAMTANAMVKAFALKVGATITWMNWFTAAIVPGVLSMILIPLLLYFIYPPQVKKLDGAVDMAKKKLHEMGPISLNEWIMIGVFALMLILWIFGEENWGVSTATTGLIGLSILLFSKILTWEDILGEKEAWNTMIWLGVLLTMARFLQEFGFIDWFGGNIGSMLQGMDSKTAFLLLVAIYFYSHYLFASNTAQVSAMFAGFLSVAVAIGIPPLPAALSLGFISSLFSCTTHYGSAACSILFAAGYVPIQTWWFLGFIISFVHLFIWMGIGGVWWSVLGYW